MPPRPDLRPETLVALEAVERGLEIARVRGGAGDVTFKAARDLVTGTDVAVEDTVRRIVGETRYPIVGEERGGETSDDGSYWLVDPICGTRNFASGIPLCGVNVALVEDGEVALGLVGDPSTGEIHLASGGVARGPFVARSGAGWRLSTTVRRSSSRTATPIPSALAVSAPPPRSPARSAPSGGTSAP